MEAIEELSQLSDSMHQGQAILADEDVDENSTSASASSRRSSTFLNVVALGNIGAGKSAVLNSLIGHPVLPTGENGATRAPISIDLQRDGSLSSKSIILQIDNKSQQVSASALRHSLQDRLSKSISGRTRDEIYLKLRTSTAPPLKLVDLPGLDQRSADESMLSEYAEHNDAILLVIIPASQAPEVASSKALRLVKEYDGDGTRTVGVISKIDQAASDQKALAAVQALLLNQAPARASEIPWVALIGQSVSIASAQSGSENSLETAWRAESESLKSILTGAPQSKLGRIALVDALAQQIRNRMKIRLPNLLSGNMENWEIVHIPDKPPMAPDQQPTVDVIASFIDPKVANTLVRRLNQIAQLENLRHVKRVKKKFVEGGKTQLSVILCLASENGNPLDSISHDVKELVNSHQLSPFITKVCKFAALSKEEWEEQCKLWPTSYHPPTYNIDGIMGFGEEDSQSVCGFMKYAIQLAKSGDNVAAYVNSAIIVDPSVKQVIATGCDQASYTHENKTTPDIHCFEEPEDSFSHSESALPSNSLPVNSKQLYASVSCLNPWRWAEQQVDSSSCSWHPLQHAAMAAIESSAARDIHLFPSSGRIQDKYAEIDHTQSSSAGSPAKRQKTHSKNVLDESHLDNNDEGSSSLSTRPYLCTGFDIYLAWEPCIMCAMALVHQRIRRIFFALPNPNAGALGTVHRLQGERSLNHHYAVFRVMVPEHN